MSPWMKRADPGEFLFIFVWAIRLTSCFVHSGYGTVRFATEEEATRAIVTLNGAEFDGRIITVRMDKYQQ